MRKKRILNKILGRIAKKNPNVVLYHRYLKNEYKRIIKFKKIKEYSQQTGKLIKNYIEIEVEIIKDYTHEIYNKNGYLIKSYKKDFTDYEYW